MLGVAILVCGGFYETYTTRDCLFPPSTFKNITAGSLFLLHPLEANANLAFPPVIILFVTFLHNFAFNAGTFYLALYYQVKYFCSSTPLPSRH